MFRNGNLSCVSKTLAYARCYEPLFVLDWSFLDPSLSSLSHLNGKACWLLLSFLPE